jgi:hypothetical protein
MSLRDLQQQRNGLRVWHALAAMAWVVFGVAVAIGLGNSLTLIAGATPLGFALLYAAGALPILALTCCVLIGINTHFVNSLAGLERRIALHPGTAVEQARLEIDATLSTYQQWLQEDSAHLCSSSTVTEIRQYVERAVQRSFTRAIE